MTSVINSLAVCITLLGPWRQGAPGAHLGLGGMAFRMGQPPPQQSTEGVRDEAMAQTIRGMLDQLGEEQILIGHGTVTERRTKLCPDQGTLFHRGSWH